ncbi:MAG: aspartyl protease family protein [candidate division Zixibacteria bacterium]|nr:aspartyl protease family protein [candidate division Zixibacteria bacterium]
MKHSIHTALVVILIVSFAAGLIEADVPIPFSLKRGIPEIEVIINDSIKATFVIDTGADHVYIDKTFAEKHGLLSGRTQPMRPTRGSKGVTESKLIKVESLKFGENAFRDISVVAIDLVSQIKDTSMGYPDGILGSNFLRTFPFILDYVHYQIRFQALRKAALSATIPIELRRHFIIVKVTINDSVKTKMILDTGSSYTILTPNVARSLGLAGNQSHNSLVNVTLDKKYTIKEVVFLIRDISEFGADSEIGGIIGTTFLQESVLFINWDSKELWFDH